MLSECLVLYVRVRNTPCSCYITDTHENAFREERRDREEGSLVLYYNALLGRTYRPVHQRGRSDGITLSIRVLIIAFQYTLIAVGTSIVSSY